MRDIAWVQGVLFPRAASESATVQKNGPIRRRLSYTRVTRDPDAARSYSEGHTISAQITHRLADAFGRLSPELQASLRSGIVGKS